MKTEILSVLGTVCLSALFLFVPYPAAPVRATFAQAAGSTERQSESTLPQAETSEKLPGAFENQADGSGEDLPPSAVPAADETSSETEAAPLPEEKDLWAWEEETFAPQVLDDAGRARVYDLTDSVSAWIPLPDGYYTDEVFSNRNALVIYPEDTDTLNADAAYYVYDTEDGYLDFNMDDPLADEALMLAEDEELTVEGPTEAETFQVGNREFMGASLSVSYLPEHSAPVYTTRYLIWTHLDERTIVTCVIGAASANPEPLLTMEEAARMFLMPVSLS